MTDRIYYITRTGLYLDHHGRFVDDIRNAWTTKDRSKAIKMASDYMAFVGIL